MRPAGHPAFSCFVSRASMLRMNAFTADLSRFCAIRISCSRFSLVYSSRDRATNVRASSMSAGIVFDQSTHFRRAGLVNVVGSTPSYSAIVLRRGPSTPATLFSRAAPPRRVPTHSRVNRSTMVKVRILRPSASWSATKSIPHTSLARAAARRSSRCTGTPQGAVISPFLANVYLHYVYDVWVKAWRKPCEWSHDRGALCGRYGRGLPTSTRGGFTHICATKRDGKGFQLRRKTKRKRRWDTIRRIGEELKKIRHEPVNVQGRWLASVLRGHYAYFAVPTNLAAVRTLRHHVKVRWYLSLARRSQRSRLDWRRMNIVAAKYLPMPTVLHPWPEERFLVTHPR
jgi:hypothetical protein